MTPLYLVWYEVMAAVFAGTSQCKPQPGQRSELWAGQIYDSLWNSCRFGCASLLMECTVINLLFFSLKVLIFIRYEKNDMLC